MRASFLPQLLVASFLLASVWAFPFAKDSGVTELTPKTLSAFLNTHKPAVILFYAPWCGHCKQFHPQYLTFAKGVKDVIRVGAINADQHRELAGQFGIEGFPTIKYWKMGSKKGMKPENYNGQRTSAALHNHMLSLITHNVATATNVDMIYEKAAKSSMKKALILFTTKTKSPPMFSVLSRSPHFQDRIAFILVSENLKSILKEFGVTAPLPKLLLLSMPEKTTVAYDGAVEYKAIATYLQQALGITSGSTSQSVPVDEEEKKPSETKKADGETDANKKKEEKKAPTPALPVEPVELTPEDFRTFCAYGAPKLHGQQPFCVISFGESHDLKALHAHFITESILFFYAKDGKALEYADKLTSGLRPLAPIEKEDVLVLRAAKDRTKYVLWKGSDYAHLPDKPQDTMTTLIEKALAGETTFEKYPQFPKL